MRRGIVLLAAIAMFAPALVRPAPGHAKAPPPAFGEAPPADKRFEAEEEDEEEFKKKRKPRQTLPSLRRGKRPQKLHIQLDGDEDGGGLDSDDGGEF